MIYILDSCFFIDTNRDHLPIVKYPQFWTWLLNLAEQKKVSIPVQVHEELIHFNDDLAIWMDKNKNTFVNGNNGLSSIVRVMSEGYGSLEGSLLEQLRADPWIIASAAAMSGCVVTSEKGGKHTAPRRKKIISVCDNLGVPHLTITAFLWEMRASMPA